MDNDLTQWVFGKKYVSKPATNGCEGCCTTYGTELCLGLGVCSDLRRGNSGVVVYVIWGRAEATAPVEDRLRAAIDLIDGAYEIVELYEPQSPAQEAWQKHWLEEARALGAVVS